MHKSSLINVIFLALSIVVVGCQELDSVSRVDYCRGQNNAYFSGATWKPYSIHGKTYVPQKCYNYDQYGEASWYGPYFHGRQTACGQLFNQHDLTAAHRTLPLPCLVRVTNLKNSKSVVVMVTDRGPYVKGKSKRIIDLSKGAFEKIADIHHGVANVRVHVLEKETRELITKMRTRYRTAQK